MRFMKHRIMIDVWVEKKADAKKIYECVKAQEDNFVSVSKEERWRINYHKCYHDEAVNKPCEIVEELKDKEAKQRSTR